MGAKMAKNAIFAQLMAEEKDILASAVEKEYSEGFVTDKKLL